MYAERRAGSSDLPASGWAALVEPRLTVSAYMACRTPPKKCAAGTKRNDMHARYFIL